MGSARKTLSNHPRLRRQHESLARVLSVALVFGTVLIPTLGSSSGQAAAAANPGYLEVAADAQVYSYGAQSFGPNAGLTLNDPIVGVATDLVSNGYWEVAADGGIFSYGAAKFFGSTGDIHLNRPIVGMASTPDAGGYWLVASDGGIFSYGDAKFYGSTGNLTLNEPIVGMASTPDGGGYWLVASDGGIFSYGDAHFYGSTGNLVLNQPIVGMAATAIGTGYWMVASDGGIFAFGDAAFHGSTGNLTLNSPIVGMAADIQTGGYWLVASDGGIFSFTAPFRGSIGGQALGAPIVAMAVANPAPPPPPPCPTPTSGSIPPPPAGRPYWIIESSAVTELEQAGLSSSLVDFFFNNRQTYVIGSTCSDPDLPDATPIVSITDESSILPASPYFNALPKYVAAVLYDNESWSFTPPAQQVNPAEFSAKAEALAHQFGRQLIFTPAPDLYAGQGSGTNYANYLSAGIAGTGAAASDVFEIQSQGLENSPTAFTNFVDQAAAQANVSSPTTVVLGGLSTNNGDSAVTASELMTAYGDTFRTSGTTSGVQGYWLNIPSTNQYCPNCGPADPAPAVGFLQMLGASLGQ